MINYNWEGVIYDHNFIHYIKNYMNIKFHTIKLFFHLQDLILINGIKIFVKDILLKIK